MGENKVNAENYIVIQGWMVRELDLKGNELLIYAIIYGFSQTDNQVFSGSLQYLADWTNSSKQSVIKCLKSLAEKQLIIKNDKYINGVKFCEYYATKFNRVCNKVEYPMQQSLIGGMQQSLTNNIDKDNIANNIANNIDTLPDDKSIRVGVLPIGQTCNDVIALYHTICTSYPKLRTKSAARMKTIAARLRTSGMDAIKEVFTKAEASDFLKGNNKNGWKASFDWIIKESNFNKILEGNYDNRSSNAYQKTPVDNSLDAILPD